MTPIGWEHPEIHGERVLPDAAELENDDAVGVLELEVLDRWNGHPALKIHHIRVLLCDHATGMTITNGSHSGVFDR